MAKTSKAQLEAIKRYKAKNRGKINYTNRKSDAKKFVEMATPEDLETLKKEIEKKLNK